ncbi:MAG: hypothetical protein IK130_11770 [Oscillospiraceae bacterium]|nr:hypothetical protein [Oscillospiraceae bacterium]
MAIMSGQQAVVMDARGRISFPMQFRSVLGEDLYVSPDARFRGFLEVRSEAGYEKQINDLREEGLKNEEDPEDVEDDIRDLTKDTANLSPDKNGRITLTDKLISYAGLSGKVVVIGNGDHAEIWDADKLAEYEAQRAEIRARKRAEKDAEKKANKGVKKEGQ